jgi:hypothetical protein
VGGMVGLEVGAADGVPLWQIIVVPLTQLIATTPLL